VSDFAQPGLIATLQRLNDLHLPQIENELCELTGKKKIALVLPCHANDLGRPALAHIARELADAQFLSTVFLSVNGIGPDEFKSLHGDRLPIPGGRILWNSASRGKGDNVANALEAICVQAEHDIVALQDCDVASFRRADLARLCYSVAHPELGYRFAKTYYSRVTDRLYGRVTRLFLAPLLHALVRVAGHHPLLDFLLSFRYPLSGEVAMTRELAAQLPRSSGWGVEISQLCAVFRRVDPREICQVDGGSGYDHKHQPATTALADMAGEIAGTLFDELAAEGLPQDSVFRASVAKMYRREAIHALKRSASLAKINGLPFDAEEEEGIVEAFAVRL
jgi:glucosyl-3-phosphoglycerate synthase